MSFLKNTFLLLLTPLFITCNNDDKIEISYPDLITVKAPAQAPEGIEYNKNDKKFLLGSVNGLPIISVTNDGTVTKFSNGESFPLSTAGLHIDYEENRLLAAASNGVEAFDDLASTVGQSNLRIYDLQTGVLQQDILLSDVAPGASAYFANDIAVDNKGSIYVSDWFANVIYKVDEDYKVSLFWQNPTTEAWPNGMDFHPDGYLLVSLINQDFSKNGLVKIPVNNPTEASNVTIVGNGYNGFDGMVMNKSLNIIGVTNNGTSPGGNVLIELSSSDNWATALIVNSVPITESTTIAVTPKDDYYVINQDFQNVMANDWIIEKIKF